MQSVHCLLSSLGSVIVRLCSHWVAEYTFSLDTHLFPKLPHQNLAFSFFSLEYTVSEYHTVLCRCSSTNCAQLMYSLNFLRPIKFGLFFPGEETFEAGARSSFRTVACNRAKNVGSLLLLPDLQSELLRFPVPLFPESILQIVL